MSVGESTVVADGWGWRFGASPSLSNDGVSFTITAGERVLLLGPSGSGKSTLLRGIAGLLGDDEGEARGSLRVASPRVGFVLQDPDTQAVLARVGDDVAFGCENLGVPADQIWSRVRQALELVELRVGLDHSTSALSGGQKQRLALAGALAMEPEVLLLDEPTANLDPRGANLVRSSVARIAEQTNATVIIVEHRLDLWWDFATRVIVLGESGELIADGSPEWVLGHSRAELDRAGIWLPDFSAPHAPPLMTGDMLLTAQSLSVARRGQPVIQEDLSFSLTQGEFVVVTGPNGCGKSTLALTMGGLLAPHGGSLRASESLSRGAGSEPVRWTSKQLHSRIGNVFQVPAHQFVRSSVLDELTLSAKTAHIQGDARQRAVSQMLERMGLSAHASSNPFALSGGQQRRLSVATALISQPQLVVLDEPTFGQDANTWRELVALMQELCAQGSAVVAMTHDPHLVGSAEREIALGAGR
jgi:energy-coupling factor transport system ATP-binding protein